MQNVTLALGVSGSTTDSLGEPVNYIDCSEKKRELFSAVGEGAASVFRFLSFEDELQFSLLAHSSAVALDLHPEGRLVGRCPRQIDNLT